ncbi:MAG: hypothetical protein WA398_11225, partial [Nitrososphaeraceae archaeon]
RYLNQARPPAHEESELNSYSKLNMFFSTRYLLHLKVFQLGKHIPIHVFWILKLDIIAHVWDIVRPFRNIMSSYVHPA